MEVRNFDDLPDVHQSKQRTKEHHPRYWPHSLLKCGLNQIPLTDETNSKWDTNQAQSSHYKRCHRPRHDTTESVHPFQSNRSDSVHYTAHRHEQCSLNESVVE